MTKNEKGVGSEPQKKQELKKSRPEWEKEVPELLQKMQDRGITYVEITKRCGWVDDLTLHTVTNIANNRTRPPRGFTRLFIEFLHNLHPRVTLPQQLEEEFENEPLPCRSCSESMETQDVESSAQPHTSPATAAGKDGDYEVRVVIGRNTSIDKETAFYGDSSYWLIYSLNPGEGAVHKCRLFKKFPESSQPEFRSWRFAEDGTKYFQVGSYFSNGKELFLLGSRNRFLDVRMSLFHCNPGGDPAVLRGITSGLTDKNEVFSAKAVLIKHACRCERDLCPCETSQSAEGQKTGVQPWEQISGWLGNKAGVVESYLFDRRCIKVPAEVQRKRTANTRLGQN